VTSNIRIAIILFLLTFVSIAGAEDRYGNRCTRGGLSQWEGSYSYDDGYLAHVWSYGLTVCEEKGGLIGFFYADGHMTLDRYKCRLVERGKQLDVLFYDVDKEDPDYNPGIPVMYKGGTILFSLKRTNNILLTRWKNYQLDFHPSKKWGKYFAKEEAEQVHSTGRANSARR
jgi:hypothetical protein